MKGNWFLIVLLENLSSFYKTVLDLSNIAIKLYQEKNMDIYMYKHKNISPLIMDNRHHENSNFLLLNLNDFTMKSSNKYKQ